VGFLAGVLKPVAHAVIVFTAAACVCSRDTPAFGSRCGESSFSNDVMSCLTDSIAAGMPLAISSMRSMSRSDA
jgi:hypothetical protein